MIRRGKYGVLLLLIFLSVACNDVQKKEINNDLLFSVTHPQETGIDFSNDLQNTADLNIVEYLYYYNGGGVGIGDFNNDGLEDIFFTANQKSDKLYFNKGNLQFEDVTEKAGISTSSSWSSGVSVEDVNGDSHLDIYVSKVGMFDPSSDIHNLLYINDGKGNFTEQSKEYGLDFKGYSTQSCFLDYDKDGDLDMYLLNHAVHSVRSYGNTDKRSQKDPVSGDRFYENKISEEGKFVDVTEQSGIYNSPLGYGLAIAAADVNNDGWTDIYIGNDFHENDYLYLNNGKKSFEESVNKAFPYTSQFSMGVDVADMNNDGWADVFTTDMMPDDPEVLLQSAGEDTDKIKEIKDDLGFEVQNARNHFQINDGSGKFVDIAYSTKTFATDWSWAVLLEDFDNNTMTDVFITNGIVNRPNDLDYINYLNSEAPKSDYKAFIKNMPSQPLENHLFLQNKNLQFDKSNHLKNESKTFSNGAAVSDLDNDGDLDIVVNNINQPAYILENKTDGNANYLTLKLTGNAQYPSVKGSKVEVFAGDKILSKELRSTKGFQSSSTQFVHFGLGEITNIDSLRVHWSNGYKETKNDVGINQALSYVLPDNSDPIGSAITVLDNNEFILPFKHEENNYKDEDAEKLVPRRLSREGPALLCEDLNGDGYNDIYIGGARNQKAKLLFGQTDGSYKNQSVPDFESDAKYEDVDVATIDFDKDGDRDLYVVSGGNDNPELNKLLEDRLYLNHNGQFKRVPMSLPHTNGGTISVSDFNNDGYEDLFIGARSIPGSYGLSPFSFLLKNNEGKALEIEFKERFGMITDSQWADMDNDGDEDLVMCGDWMKIRYLENQDGQMVEKTSDYKLNGTEGFWNTIELHDVNGDSKLDILAGNIGLNTKWSASDSTPITLYLGDFDQNGYSDPLIFHSYFGRYVPFASLDKLTSQIPFLKKKFNTYNAFNGVNTIEKLMDTELKHLIETKEVKELRSMIFIQNEEGFKRIPLGSNEQLGPINDFNIGKDGSIYYTGNSKDNVAQLGYSLTNPGRKLSDFDNTKEIFLKSESLNLPISIVGKKIGSFGEDKMIVLTNNDFPYVIEIQ